VQRDGDSWRAELNIGGGSIPIVGLDRSGIPSTALVDGRTATIVGIVKRAYPTATDQRLAVLPRGPADITMGGPSPSGSPHPSGSLHPTGSTGPIRSTPPGSGRPPDASGSTSVPGASDPAASGEAPSTGGAGFAVISSLSEHVGETVRIGGRIVSVSGTVVTVEDGTGQAAVRLSGGAASLVGQLRAGDLVNITGNVARTASGGLEIGVTDAAGLARIPAPASLAAASDALAASTAAAGALPLGGDDTTPVASSGSSAPLLAVALLLGVLGAALIGVVAAGPKRRARLMTGVQQSVAGARARLGRTRPVTDRG